MTKLNRWLEELPPGSPERELLAAGKAVRPPVNCAARGWAAFSIATGAAASTVTVTTNAVATIGTSAAASGALVVKAVTVGFAVGMGLLGIGYVAERVRDRPVSTPQATPIASGPALSTSARPRTTLAPSSSSRVLEAPSSTGASAVPFDLAPTRSAVPLDLAPTRQTSLAPPNVKIALRPTGVQSLPATDGAPRSVAPPANTSSERTSLAQQARDLAQVRRLIDGGAVDEAIRLIEASLLHDSHFALAEDRDALYVEAMAKSRRISQAKRLARRFLERYPNSPQRERMQAIETE